LVILTTLLEEVKLPQTKKDAQLRRKICQRIKAFSENYLGLGSRELSNVLGYGDPSTLRSVWRAESLPSIEKIVALSKIETDEGYILNLNWLFSGEGEVCVQPRKSQVDKMTTSSVEKKLVTTLRKMPVQKQRSLLNIIT
tara:strand:+ start:6637 stop:7056 length:420 start_codon:yes stop_codon:yes gene_type:complete